MNAVKTPNAEPIPGYRLIEPLGSGGFGEVWKCEAPGGLFKAVKFVHGETDDIHPGQDGAARELRALQHVKALRHPFLLGMDRVECVAGELVIVMELADRSLHDLLEECRDAGLPGVPRAELLRYFAEAAEVLDVMNQEYGLQHLDIKPRNLFLVGRHVKVGDFGLVNSLAELSGNTPSALQMGAATPLYAAPESFLGRVSLFSDQYSLAITYYELLTGQPPFLGKNFRQVALQHMQAEPDLGPLPAADRPVVARALAKEARDRFPSCTAFVAALHSGDAGAAPAAPTPSVSSRPKSATRTDVPIVDLSGTPVVPLRAPGAQDAAPERVPDTREVGMAGRTLTDVPRPVLPPAAPRAGPTGDPLAAYQFVDCIARNSAGETWTARTADGRDKLVRLLIGVDFPDGKEADRLNRVRALRHPGLDPMELVGGGMHRLAAVTDACPTTLATRLAECQAGGLPGVPRAELLDRLTEAAEALDALFRKDGVRHLGLTPRHLLLRNGRTRILHFGLMELIHLPAGQSAALLNPRYAAPELFDRRVHASSDLYSLALIYCELLTGVHPFRALGHRQAPSARHRGQPDLSLAPAPDRAVLECALHPDPACRPVSCTEFIEALEGGARSSSAQSSLIGGAAPDLALTPTTQSRMRQAINGLVAAAAGAMEVREHHAIRYLLHPGKGLEHQFFARLTARAAPSRVEAFRQEWRADLLKSDGRHFTLQAPLPGGGWQRLLGRAPGLKIHIDAPPSPEAGGATEVQVRMEPVHCVGDAAARALDEKGPRLLESLRGHLQALPERRNQARLRFEQPVWVAPVLDGRAAGEAIVSQARDISMRGMGLCMPSRPSSMLVNIRLPAEAPDLGLDVPACIVRAAPQTDGSYEVGVRFLVEE